MANPFRKFFDERMAPRAPDATDDVQQPRYDPLHVAACALLLELAHADDQFTLAERNHIHAVMMRHFALDHETAKELMELAERQRREAVDISSSRTWCEPATTSGKKRCWPKSCGA